MVFKLQKEDKLGPTVPSEVFNWRLACLAIVASGGAVIFGYDLSFISGVFSLKSFLRQFNLDTSSASHLQTNVVATFQGGAFFGVILMYYFNERYGRRLALIVAGLIFNIGVILQIASGGHIPTFYVGRIFSGMGVGGSTFAVPQYLSENSPAIARGGLIGAVSFSTHLKVLLLIKRTWIVRNWDPDRVNHRVLDKLRCQRSCSEPLSLSVTSTHKPN